MDQRFPGLPAKPRTAFFGSPAEAAQVLERMIAEGFAPLVVVTNVDKRRTRRGAPVPTPVARVAADHGIEVLHDPSELAGEDLHLGVVVAYGRILRAATLELLPLVNIHFSLLPRWRGAAPVERAILAGDEATGVCLMAVEEGLDEGEVFAEARVPIGARETAQELRSRLAALGAGMLCDALRLGGPAFSAPRPQAGATTYASKLTQDDLRIDFGAPAELAARQSRVGGAWCMAGGKRLKVLEAMAVAEADAVEAAGLAPGEMTGEAVACSPGLLRLLRVQPEGGRPMSTAEWLRGRARAGSAPVLG
ncbi:MAG: methionyl-tRNA formyltransferase [Actinomycetota bacterium]|nr:methionyl-tRNA formyltransferase [Actinomycetota bacterium]MDA8208273.1 methionyl-tRNA formyltransferase [Actinomycetota bacterium]